MESGIYFNEKGNMYLVFGGKINVIAAKDDENKSVAVLFQELENKVEIGKDEPEECDKNRPAIHLIFDNTKSIDVLTDLLSKAKKQLEEYV